MAVFLRQNFVFGFEFIRQNSTCPLLHFHSIATKPYKTITRQDDFISTPVVYPSTTFELPFVTL